MKSRLATRSAFAYAPPAGAGLAVLQRAGAGAAIALIGSLVLAAFIFSSPLVLVAVGLGVVIVGLASGARPALSLAARFALPLALVMVAVNVLVSDRGATILIRGIELPVLGTLDVTLESIAAGGVIALRVVVVLAAFAVMSRCVDPDAILKLVRPFARHSALTATLIGRLVPLAAADYARLSDAAKLRGPAAAPANRAALARRLVAGALDRSLDAAATLELRGYALPSPHGRTGTGGRSRTQGAGVMAASAVAIAATAIAARVAGIAGFESYPSVEMEVGMANLAVAAAIPLLATLPVLSAHRRAARVRRVSLGPRAETRTHA